MKNIVSFITGVVLISIISSAQTKVFTKDEFKQWTQTPSMGWNSWDCYGPTVEEHEVKKFLQH
jgi:hypothetical protein